MSYCQWWTGQDIDCNTNEEEEPGCYILRVEIDCMGDISKCECPQQRELEDKLDKKV